MLRAIIVEACLFSLEVFCCFVDFWKVFDSIPRMTGFYRCCDIGILDIVLVAIIRLYEFVLGHLCVAHDLLDCTLGIS
jgi:hypothetical protein